MNVKNKVFLITGAATGIGAGITRALVKEGAKNVAALDVNVDAGEALQKELNEQHGANKVLFIKCDVTQNLDSAFDEVMKQFGYIDVVINNAGIMNDAPHIYEKEIAINVKRSVARCRYLHIKEPFRESYRKER
ncbi:unnamed protein product [Euphydryas editha]|uniref:15-hydroxyprostaglandin dehydrogenase [NAD(+)] n=1 Tax=Euphydryas editha TaxID=104508 RepID=A0AAU9TKR0_EUPED|nr:unnamed protein product [Euphydryas editha]